MSYSPAIKKAHFEYSVSKMIEWSNEVKGESLQDFAHKNDFSKLKVLKLHFFLCAINSDSNKLLELFDSFYAMPYGHVESDIYDSINSNSLARFTFDDGHLHVNNNYLANLFTSFEGLIPSHKKEIDDSLVSLKRENKELINYSAVELVDLSHLWTSWKLTFKQARNSNKYSAKIPTTVIQTESKFFAIDY